HTHKSSGQTSPPTLIGSIIILVELAWSPRSGEGPPAPPPSPPRQSPPAPPLGQSARHSVVERPAVRGRALPLEVPSLTAALAEGVHVFVGALVVAETVRVAVVLAGARVGGRSVGR